MNILRFVAIVIVVTGMCFTYALVTIIDAMQRHEHDRITQCVTHGGDNCER